MVPDSDIRDAFLAFYRRLWGSPGLVFLELLDGISLPSIGVGPVEALVQPFSTLEIECTLVALPAGKGPDGFPAEWEHWMHVGPTVLKALRDFQLHYIYIRRDFAILSHLCFIPKGEAPLVISHFRPISLSDVCSRLLSRVLDWRQFWQTWWARSNMPSCHGDPLWIASCWPRRWLTSSPSHLKTMVLLKSSKGGAC